MLCSRNLLLLCGLLLLLFTNGCDKPASADSSQQFATLAATLADPLHTLQQEQVGPVNPEDAYAAAISKLVRYQELSSAPGGVGALAAEAGKAHNDLLSAHRALSSASDGGSEALLMCVGLLVGNPVVALGGFEGAVRADESRATLVRNYTSAFHRNRGAQLALVAMAPEYAGARSSSGPLQIDVDESWGGVDLPYDVVRLRNVSGKRLSNCLIEIMVANDSDTRRNIHFVPRWEEGEWRVARYGMGVQVDGSSLGQQTVLGIQSVSASVWTSELHSESMKFTYTQAERDRDIKAALDGRLSFEATTLDVGIINHVPAVNLRLQGVGSIPAHSIKIDFHHGSEMISRTMSGNTWPRGEMRQIKPNPYLPWLPEWIQVTLSFQGTNYQWTNRVNLESGR